MLSDLSDWRSWPGERQARVDAIRRQIDDLLREAIIMQDPETRKRAMAGLVAFTIEAPVRSVR